MYDEDGESVRLAWRTERSNPGALTEGTRHRGDKGVDLEHQI